MKLYILADLSNNPFSVLPAPSAGQKILFAAVMLEQGSRKDSAAEHHIPKF